MGKIMSYLIGFVVLSFFIVGGTMMISDVNTNYNVTMDSGDWNTTFNKIDTMYNTSQEMKSQTLEGEISDTESWESMTKGSYSAIRLVKDTFGLAGAILTDINKELPIGWAIPFALVALTIFTVLSIIYMVFRYKD